MKRPSLSILRRIVITLVAFAIIYPAMFNNQALIAQEEAATEEAAATEDAADGDAAKVDESLFEVPKGDAKVLQAYIKKLAVTPPPEDAPEEEQVEFAKKALNALVTAATRLLDAKPTDEQAVEAAGFRIQALQALASLGQEDAAKQREKAIEAARNDKREQIAGLGWQTFIGDHIQRWDQLEPSDKKAFQKEIIAKVNADGPQPIDISIVQITAMQLDGTDDPFVISLLEETLPIFTKAASEEAATPTDEKPAQRRRPSNELASALADSSLEGVLRRLSLPGNPIKISGDLLSGGEVDWESYRGKVVLVDFWATWCGPCRAEVPNILAMYDAYHEKGFDVLGVSLDKTPEAANKYAQQYKLPWDSLFPQNEDDRFWNHPLARYYGIGGIPTAILVDKEGKVVHMNARGENLPAELQRLLGDPIVKPEAEEDAADAETETEAPAEAS